MPHFRYERKAGASEGRVVVGVDEAGRGPLAGPVAAAAVLIDLDRFPRRLRAVIDDSKKLAPELREEVYERLQGHALIGVGLASSIEIDRLNILRASLLAMRRAVDALGLTPDHALVDGNVPPDLPCAITTIVEGDCHCCSIAAASIVAKVVRDRLMRGMAAYHPEYGWEHNAGYSTPEHLLALARYGPTLQHRRSFRSVREHLLVRV